jgi:hypothetical protein
VTCYFCGREIVGRVERHHIIPKRYYQRGSNHSPDNLADAHHDCHLSFHKEYDNPHWKLKEFRRYVGSINYGLGIFA